MPSRSNRISIAVDIGGTFTDIVLADRSNNSFFVTKTSSTPDNPAVGFFHAIDSVLKLSNANVKNVEIVFHGSTVATNAILENKGVKTALITSRGFRHVLEIGRAEIPEKQTSTDGQNRRGLFCRGIFLKSMRESEGMALSLHPWIRRT